jgi:hypothetical protein
MEKNLRISSYIRKPFLIYEFAPIPSEISLFMRKILFSIYHFWIERKNFKKRKRERNYRKEGRALYQRKREEKSSR